MIVTLRARLTLVYTAVFGALLIVLGAASYQALAYQMDADVTASLAELTSGLHGYLRFENGTPAIVFDANDPDQAAFIDEATRYYALFDASSGEAITQSEALAPLGLQFTQAEVRQFRDRPVVFDLQTDYGRIRLSNSVLTAPGGKRYLLQVGVSLAAMDRVLQRFFVVLVVGVPAALVATLAAGRAMTGVVLRPVAELAQAAGAIEIEDLRRRLPVRGAGDELDAVALAFNDTLGRLEHAVGEMRQFSTALAHEIRTPLAALRSSLEKATLEGAAGDVQSRLAEQLEEIDKLSRLIGQILMLARAEAGEIPLAMTAVDLGTLAESLVDQIEPVARAKGVTLTFEEGNARAVRGDADWLKRLVLNLLDNAIKFTPSGGRVVVRVSSGDPDTRLSVQDTGAGIPPDALNRIFERFFRADPARSATIEGVGLGLSLAKWIVDRHRGRIDVESVPGSGTTFTVYLPVAASGD